MKISRLLSTLGVCLGLSVVVTPVAQAQSYPAKPVRIIVAFGAGSGTDIIARYLSDLMTKSMNQSFIVDNRVGANGNIGLSAGAKSPNDGYTLVLGGLGVNAMNQFLYPPGVMGFDPEKDFDTVILVGKLPFLVTVSPALPVNTLAELISAAKARPGSLNTSISTTTSRLVYELFKKTTGADVFGVAYKTPASAIVDVLAGRVEVAIETVATLRPHVAAGKLKALAITSRASSEVMPGVRSAIEQGVADLEFVGWVSMYMPKGSPRAAINTINAEANRILALPDTRKRFADLGVEPGGGTPKDMLDFEESERRRWGPMIKAANIRAE